MKLFIVADQNGVIQALTYSFAEALEKAQIDWPVTEHDLPPLIDLIAPYFTHRKLVVPNAEGACLFLVSEVGELADALVSNRQEWVRNNPDKHKDLAGEIGDVLMMLVMTADALGLDPLQCLAEKMKRKGFDPNS